MTGEDEVRRMTVAEIAVMREIVRWRKANGVEFSPCTPFQVHQHASWYQLTLPRIKRQVTWGREDPGKIGEVQDYYRESFRWHEVDSVQQAIDLLVSLGYLPARFSSAYRAGWDARDELIGYDPRRIEDREADLEPAVPSYGAHRDRGGDSREDERR